MKTQIITTLIASFITKMKTVFMSFFTLKGVLFFPVLAVPFVIKIEYTLVFLLGLMVVDFITGVWASDVIRRKKLKTDSSLQGKFTILSEDLKKSGVKFSLYAITILSAFALEKIFFIKSFSFDFTEAELTITIFVVGFWICVELYSIVFENIKKIGFDVYGYIKKAIQKLKGIKSEIATNNTQEYE